MCVCVAVFYVYALSYIIFYLFLQYLYEAGLHQNNVIAITQVSIFENPFTALSFVVI